MFRERWNNAVKYGPWFILGVIVFGTLIWGMELVWSAAATQQSFKFSSGVLIVSAMFVLLACTARQWVIGLCGYCALRAPIGLGAAVSGVLLPAPWLNFERAVMWEFFFCMVACSVITFPYIGRRRMWIVESCALALMAILFTLTFVLEEHKKPHALLPLECGLALLAVLHVARYLSKRKHTHRRHIAAQSEADIHFSQL